MSVLGQDDEDRSVGKLKQGPSWGARVRDGAAASPPAGRHFEIWCVKLMSYFMYYGFLEENVYDNG